MRVICLKCEERLQIRFWRSFKCKMCSAKHVLKTGYRVAIFCEVMFVLPLLLYLAWNYNDESSQLLLVSLVGVGGAGFGGLSFISFYHSRGFIKLVEND